LEQERQALNAQSVPLIRRGGAPELKIGGTRSAAVSLPATKRNYRAAILAALAISCFAPRP
jgi:hypothetical protein